MRRTAERGLKRLRFKAVILAGGSGERFWPLSTPERPKQFLRVFGGESLIRQSVLRLRGLVRMEDVFVITSKSLVAATRKELPELAKTHIIGEPQRRDTGAAVALGVAIASAKAEPGTVIGFFASDQMVADSEGFRKTVAAAIRRARKAGSMVAIGIKPSYPSTGFGYVDPRSGKFVEKPDARRARSYLRRGFLWNAGLFIARVDTFLAALETHAPEYSGLLSLRTDERAFTRKLSRVYSALPKLSFDYAVMEKLSRVDVVRGDFGWDDVGSYAAFDRYFPHDSRGNVREGPCTVVEADGNICVARSARISLLGVKNLVVVTTPDCVLVADKARISEMKRLFTR